MVQIIPVRGRPAAPIAFEVVRELGAADIFRLVAAPGPKTGVAPIQKIREIHRRQARLIAEGLKITDVAIRCDTTPARLHQQMEDPSFINLIAYYREQADDVTVETVTRIQERLVDIADAATAEIYDRLDDEGKRAGLPFGELRKAAELGLDRTVAPPKSAGAGVQAPVQITFNIPGRGLRETRTLEPEPDPALPPSKAKE